MSVVKIITCILFAALTLSVRGIPASAHTLTTDGTIGATVHITPDDDPVVGQEAVFYFEIKDTTNQFNPTECNCIVSITKDGKQMYSASVFETTTTADFKTPSLTYIFPEKGMYRVSLVGKPDNAGSFQPFTLTYDIRIAREGVVQRPVSQSGGVFVRITAVITIIIVFVLLAQSNKKRTNTGRKTAKRLSAIVLLVAAVSLLHILHATRLLVISTHDHNHHTSEHACCMPLTDAMDPTVRVSLPPHYRRSLTLHNDHSFEIYIREQPSIRAPPNADS